VDNDVYDTIIDTIDLHLDTVISIQEIEDRFSFLINGMLQVRGMAMGAMKQKEAPEDGG
jgi:hypothetical protein